MRIANIFQFILGFFLGMVLLTMAGAGTAYFFFNRMAEAPPRPVFSDPEVDRETEPFTPVTDSETTASKNPVENGGNEPAELAEETEEPVEVIAEDMTSFGEDDGDESAELTEEALSSGGNDSVEPVESAEVAEEVNVVEEEISSPPPEPDPEPRDDAYKARVIWSTGLSLRAEPSQNSGRLGGVNYNDQVTIIGQSSDGVWQKIRLDNGTEAWVKAGNLERVN